MALDFPTSPSPGDLHPVSPAAGEEQFKWDDTHQTWRRVASAVTGVAGPIGPQGAMATKNQLINGAFDVWQRGTSFSANGYTADRWVNLTVQTVSRQSAPGLIVGGVGSQYVCQMAANGNIEQRVENHWQFIPGETWIISYKSFGAFNFFTSFDSQGFVQTDPDGSFVVPARASPASLTVNIVNTDAGNSQITDIQLEKGSVATDFERRLFAAELNLCYRYFQYRSPGNVNFGAYATNAYYTVWGVVPTMRSAPIFVTDFSTASFASNINGALGDNGCEMFIENDALLRFRWQATAAGTNAWWTPSTSFYTLDSEL